ncbi:NAD(P)/FAD-dependent oxidoreductase [Vagococcus entomophilus]|uniref:Rhodanese domain-containing protein n=1 Tax=Vagococcus entomophilus TaxID=1160095 RepID=A0A430AJI2_9ENTE|nr:FAD-dependent oxidoreductase [Vagococcus entomophilus]RSU08077.1 hypothetical protein CBF30_02200 [Vagococcus entomophilus]
MKIGIIGGGVVGSTAAFYLQQSGKHQVMLLDDGFGQATSAAAGIISPWLSQRRNKAWYELAREGAKFYPELLEDLTQFVSGFSPSLYAKVGTLLFKKNEKLLQKLEKIAGERKKEAPEIGEIVRLSPEQIKKRFPLLEPQTDALYISGGARVDGALLIKTLKQAFIRTGGEFRQSKVTGIEPQLDKWDVYLNQERLAFDFLILATGAWLPSLLEPLGFTVDVRPQKGQLVGLQTKLQTHTWPVVMPQGEGDLIPSQNGELLVGATHENDQAFDLSFDSKKIHELIVHASDLAPKIASFKQEFIRTGTRAYTSDYLPFFGAPDSTKHLYVASGLGSSGLTTGPIIGKMLAQKLLEQKTTLSFKCYTPGSYITKKEK